MADHTDCKRILDALGKLRDDPTISAASPRWAFDQAISVVSQMWPVERARSAKLTPEQEDAVRACGRYVLDRACQYDESSGSYDALTTTGADIIRGDAAERWREGELDDPHLLAWQKRIR
jgi:hypothetical protein